MADGKGIVIGSVTQGDLIAGDLPGVGHSGGVDTPAHIAAAVVELAVGDLAAGHIGAVRLVVGADGDQGGEAIIALMVLMFIIFFCKGNYKELAPCTWV